MSDGRVGNLGAILREAFAVLAAILIAFALDAWWDGQVERRDMREALDAVGDEIDRNLAAIDAALVQNADQAALIQEAMGLSPAEVRALSVDEVLRLSELPNYELVTLRLGAATAFVQGGHLEVLDDRSLRTEVAGLPRIQAEIDEEAEGVSDITRQLSNSLLAAVPLDFMSVEAGEATEGMRAMLDAVVQDEDVRRLLVARTFFLVGIYGEELGALRAELAALRAMIHAELGTTADALS